MGRTAFSNTYRNADGSETIRLTTEPANVKDAAGRWQPVDTSVAANAGSARAVVTRHPLSPSFGGHASDQAVMRVSAGPRSASLRLVGASADSAARVSGSTVTYPDVLAGTDLRYDVTPGSVKETLVLHSAPSQGRWLFGLDTAGLTPAIDASGQVVLRDAAGSPQMLIPPVEVWDSGGGAGKPPAQTTGRYELTATTAAWLLAVVVDDAWLSDPDRVYPVSVDPTVTTAAVSVISYKDDGTQVTNDGIKVGNSLGGVGGGDSVWRSIVKFDYSPVFGKRVVGTRVDVAWDQVAAQSHSRWQVDMWHATAFNFNGKGEYLAFGQVGDNGNLRGPEPASGLDTLTSYIKSVVDANVNTAQFMFGGVEDSGTWTYKRANMSLLVDTGSAPPAPTLVAPADNSVMTTTTPTIQTSAVTDADAEPVRYAFRVATGADGNSGIVIDSPSLTTPSWTVPAGVLQDGVSYTWQVRATSNLTTTRASWVGHFRVDKRIGDHGPAPTDTVGPVSVNLANGNATVATSSPSFTTVGGSAGLSFTYNSQQTDQHGLTASYFNDDNHNLIADDGEPSLVRTEPQVNVDWGSGSPYPDVISNDWFVARWQGFFEAPVTNTYQFAGVHDDRLTVTVNNVQVYNWTHPSAVNYTSDQGVGSVALTAGQRVPITVELAEATSPAYARLHVRTADGTTVPDQIVPPEMLYRSDLPSLPEGWTLSADVDGSGAAYTSALVTAQNVVLTDSSGAKHTWVKKSSGGPTRGRGRCSRAGRDGQGHVVRRRRHDLHLPFRRETRHRLLGTRRIQAGGAAVRL